MTREELLSSKEYWQVEIQTNLYNVIEQYRKDHGLNKTQLAEKLGVTKGYISQVLNGDYDHKISKWVELSLAFGMVPIVGYKHLEDIIKKDAGDTTMKLIRNTNNMEISYNSYAEISNDNNELLICR